MPKPARDRGPGGKQADEPASRIELGHIRTPEDGVLSLHATVRGGSWTKAAFGKHGASSFEAEFTLDGQERRRLNLIQAVSINGGKWKLDHGDAATNAPFYTENTFGKLIVLGDTPSLPRKSVLQFVTAVVALDGADAGRVLGLLRWQETVSRPLSKLFSSRPEDTRAEDQSQEDAFDRAPAWEQLRKGLSNDTHTVR